MLPKFVGICIYLVSNLLECGGIFLQGKIQREEDHELALRLEW
ncbi:MAG: hypothetical protein V5788_08840 [Shewanella sp.]